MNISSVSGMTTAAMPAMGGASAPQVATQEAAQAALDALWNLAAAEEAMGESMTSIASGSVDISV